MVVYLALAQAGDEGRGEYRGFPTYHTRICTCRQWGKNGRVLQWADGIKQITCGGCAPSERCPRPHSIRFIFDLTLRADNFAVRGLGAD